MNNIGLDTCEGSKLRQKMRSEEEKIDTEHSIGMTMILNTAFKNRERDRDLPRRDIGKLYDGSERFEKDISYQNQPGGQQNLAGFFPNYLEKYKHYSYTTTQFPNITLNALDLDLEIRVEKMYEEFDFPNLNPQFRNF